MTPWIKASISSLTRFGAQSLDQVTVSAANAFGEFLRHLDLARLRGDKV